MKCLTRKAEREALATLKKLYGSVKVLRRTKKSHLVILVEGKVITTIPSSTSDKKRWFNNLVSSINRMLV